jgi:AbrB family looped-hinge helix DNA binding protein
MTTTISSKGQITVPVNIRDALGLTPGTKLEIELGPDGVFLARKVASEDFFAKFQGIGIPVFRDGDEAMEILRGPVEPGDID